MISVFGATGQVGGRVAATLLEAGVPVRILTRSTEKIKPLENEGAEILQGTLENVEDIKSALDRCDGAFLMTPLNWSSDQLIEEELAIGKNYAEALKDSTVRHVVYLSVINAREGTGVPHIDSKAVIEDAIATAGVEYTLLRPAYFMENIYYQWPLIQQMGIISYPIAGDVAIPMVATEDVAYAAVQALMRGGKGQEAFEILGPRDYSFGEIAEILSGIIEKPVRYQEAPPDEFRQMVIQHAGMSAASADDVILMYQAFRTMEFKGDRNRVYDEFNFSPTPLETVLSTAAGALRTEAM